MLSYCIGCCGIAEYQGVQYADVYSFFKEMCVDLKDEISVGHPAFIFFSSVDKEKSAKKFAAYLRKQNVGEVLYVGTRENPNSGNSLSMYVYKPDYAKLKANKIWKAVSQ